MKHIQRVALWAALASLALLAACVGARKAVPNTGGILPGTVINIPADIPLPGQRQTVDFTAGSQTAVVTATLKQGVPQAYQMQSPGGQRLYLAVNGPAAYQIYDPGGLKLSAALAESGPLAIMLDRAGAYSIALAGQGDVTMSLYLSASEAGPLPANLKRIDVPAPQAAAGISLTLAGAQPVGFTFDGLNDQPVLVNTGGHVTVMLVTPDDQLVEPSARTPGESPTGSWGFALPEGGRYTLALLGSGLVQVSLQQLALPAGAATAIPLPKISQRVTFPAGQSTATLQITLAPGAPQAYIVTARQGQAITVLASNNTAINIYGPGGGSLTLDHPSYTQGWSTPAYQSGDYQVVAAGSGPVTLTINVMDSGK